MNRGTRLLWTNIGLVVVGLLDLATTIFWLQTQRMVEGNPIMAGVLHHGLPLFIFVKVVTLATFVFVMEAYRLRNAKLAKAVSQFSFLAYIGIYCVSFVAVNHRFLLG